MRVAITLGDQCSCNAMELLNKIVPCLEDCDGILNVTEPHSK